MQRTALDRQPDPEMTQFTGVEVQFEIGKADDLIRILRRHKPRTPIQLSLPQLLLPFMGGMRVSNHRVFATLRMDKRLDAEK